MIHITFSYKDGFLKFYYFYFNELPKDKYNLTSDLIKEGEDLLTILVISLEITEWKNCLAGFHTNYAGNPVTHLIILSYAHECALDDRVFE